jgi:hypothetical protein
MDAAIQEGTFARAAPLVAAGHFADRVFGRIARADGRFTWRPYGG